GIPESVQNDAFIDNIAESEPINGDSHENQSGQHILKPSNHPLGDPFGLEDLIYHYEYEKVEALRESTTPQDSKKRLKEWSSIKRRNKDHDRKVIQDSFIKIDLRLDKRNGLPDDLTKCANLFCNLKDINHKDSIYLAQKAKIKWAIEGDENSKKIHGIMNKKIRHLYIKAWDQSLFDVNFPWSLNSDQVFDLEDMLVGIILTTFLASTVSESNGMGGFVVVFNLLKF
nr:RNA-directed DNA polymerase, eukaryota, reverse transcriptase zinc-binding domain protein [Tanacetum cinerariifolium]